MTYAFRLTTVGTPDVLEWQKVQISPPGPGEVRLRHTVVGLNYIDILQRRGLYPIQIPGGLGMEGAGIVVAVGGGVSEFKEGDRVAYAGGPLGAYSVERVISAAHLIRIPDEISDQEAAAVLLQGMTAQFLVRNTYKVRASDTILVHAAAGGVGSILCQWAKALGATVIGTVSSDEKAEIASRNGCEHTIVYTREDFVERVIDITNGRKLPVVYDSVGKDTFIKSFDCLQPFGVMVLFGQSSGIIDPLETRILTEKGSLYLTRPALWDHVRTRDRLLATANEVFGMVQTGKVKVPICQTYSLKDAPQAHRDVEARKTTGSTVLIA